MPWCSNGLYAAPMPFPAPAAPPAVETSVVTGCPPFARQPSHGPPLADKRSERRPNSSHWLGRPYQLPSHGRVFLN